MDALRPDLSTDLDFDLVDLGNLTGLGGGEPKGAPPVGVKALMLAVLEDAIRCYLDGKGADASEAEIWMISRKRRSPFDFENVCEMLDLDASAVRRALLRLVDPKSARRKFRRVRNNGRMPGQVCLRPKRQRARATVSNA